MRCIPLLLVSSIITVAPLYGQRAPKPPLPFQRLAGTWEAAPIMEERRSRGECSGYGEYVSDRRPARLVIRPEEMWFHPFLKIWRGGIYAWTPWEFVCRGPAGEVIVRQNLGGPNRPAGEAEAVWDGDASASVRNGRVTIDAGRYVWRVHLITPGARSFSVVDAQGTRWEFTRVQPDPARDAVGMYALIADFDGDRAADHIQVLPGPSATTVVLVEFANVRMARFEGLARGALVTLATQTRWRNADGTTLDLPQDRSALVISENVAPGRTEVTIFYVQNGGWKTWKYTPE